MSKAQTIRKFESKIDSKIKKIQHEHGHCHHKHCLAYKDLIYTVAWVFQTISPKEEKGKKFVVIKNFFLRSIKTCILFSRALEILLPSTFANKLHRNPYLLIQGWNSREFLINRQSYRIIIMSSAWKFKPFLKSHPKRRITTKNPYSMLICTHLCTHWKMFWKKQHPHFWPT